MGPVDRLGPEVGAAILGAETGDWGIAGDEAGAEAGLIGLAAGC